jgi:precorrin-6B methylase 1
VGIGVNNQLSECSRKIKQELRQWKQGKEEQKQKSSGSTSDKDVIVLTEDNFA